ncbi:hypothetical protein EI94DRAFT_1703634 [Lactarius quietus]|nr:hypothetical protein EI94DRAFT_1703634 [Lactarius quietus]
MLFHILVWLLMVHSILSLFYILVGSTSATLIVMTLSLAVAIKHDPAERCASKASLWRLMKTMPGMIALAATVLMFICGPDQTFSDKSKGVSSVDWGQHFCSYKWMILKFSPVYYKALLAWYDSQIFHTSSTASAFLDLPPVVWKDVNNVNNLIQCMNNTDIVQIGTLSNSPSLAPLTSHGSISTTMAPNGPSPTPAFGTSAAPVAMALHNIPMVEQEVHEGIDVGVIKGNRLATRGTTVTANYIAWSTRNMIRRSKGKN